METLAVYCATKAAVIMFSRVLARELADRKIRVNAFSPAGTDTAIFEKVGVEIDGDTLIPAADQACAMLALIDLPAGLDVVEFSTDKRFSVAM
jgi:NAD(P)-dependent dehydrogenase (short-subunit alcohol dehydrogenase family)